MLFEGPLDAAFGVDKGADGRSFTVTSVNSIEADQFHVRLKAQT